MTQTLSPEDTSAFRAAQKKRSGFILILILAWIAGIFALTLVKGQMAVAERERREAARSETPAPAAADVPAPQRP